MNAARVIAPFGVSAVLFVLSYLSSREPNSGMFPLLLLGVGLILAFVGVAAVFSDRKE